MAERGQGELIYAVELVLLKWTYSVQVWKQNVISVMPTAQSSIIESWLLHGYVESIPRFLWLCFTHIWMRRLPGQNGKVPHNNMSGLSIYWQTIQLENSDQQRLIRLAPSFFFFFSRSLPTVYGRDEHVLLAVFRYPWQRVSSLIWCNSAWNISV